MLKLFTSTLFVAIALVFVSYVGNFTTTAVADTSKAISTGDVSHVQNSKAFNTESGKAATSSYQGRLASNNK